MATPTGTSVVAVAPQPEEVSETQAFESEESEKARKKKMMSKTAFERILPKRASYSKKQVKKNIRSCCIDGDLVRKIAVFAMPYVKFGNQGVEVGEENTKAPPPPPRKADIVLDSSSGNSSNNNNNNNGGSSNNNNNNNVPVPPTAPSVKARPILTKFDIVTEEEKLEAELRKKEKAHAKNKRRRAAKQAAKKLAQQQQQQ